MNRNFHVRKTNSVGVLPNYRASWRGLFIQALIDFAALCAWVLLAALLTMAALSPLMFLLFLILFD